MYMSRKLDALLERAASTQYYKDLWKEKYYSFEKYPLSDKKMFDPGKRQDILAVNENQISYYYFSAGTTGKPKMIPLTLSELDQRAKYRGYCYELAGISKKSRVAILLPFGPWVAGPSAQSGLFYTGCTVFPIGLLSNDDEMKSLFKTLKANEIDTLVSTPSFIQRLLYLYEMEDHPPMFLSKIITSGEHVSDSLRERTKEVWGTEIYSSYASSESFLGIECSEHYGFHYDTNEIIIEIVDEINLTHTEDTGVIVITSLGSEAIPIVRYPMDDLGFISHSKCACGSTLPKVIWRGRTKGTFEVAGGVNITSNQIVDALSRSSVPYQKCDVEVLEREIGRDNLIFTLYRNTKNKKTKNNSLEEARSLLLGMSMDFRDVVYHNLVSISINIVEDETLQLNYKMNIKVYDRRKDAR